MRVPIVVHLLSGGVDSVTLLYDLHKQGAKIHCLLIDYDQRHRQELFYARRHATDLNVLYTQIQIPQLRGSELTDGKGGMIVPGRNALFLSHAVNLAVAAGADIVTFAANTDDAEEFPDCRSSFVVAYNAMLREAGIHVGVGVPYASKRKWEIVKLGRELGVDFNLTWSCYRAGSQPCGECHACKKRIEAFAKCE